METANFGNLFKLTIVKVYCMKSLSNFEARNYIFLKATFCFVKFEPIELQKQTHAHNFVTVEVPSNETNICAYLG